MAANESIYMVLGMLCFVITPVMTSRNVQYLNNAGLTGKKCPSTDQIFTETTNSVLQCTATCQAITGCASAFYNHMMGTCYGCYGFYTSSDTTVALDDEPNTTYHYPDLCQSGWTRHGFSCYSFQNVEMTWQNSLDECRSLDASLVDITDSDENNFLSQILPSEIHGHYWIGLNHLAGDGVWGWVDSNLVTTYTVWYVAQPNGGSAEQCALYHNPEKAWFDFPCLTPYPFVCEKTLLCPVGWTRRGNFCYRLSQDQLNWEDALKYCQSQNANHVEINDADENKFIQTKNTEGHTLWLGLNDKETESTYRWAGSNTLMTYTHWSDGEPSDSSTENCIGMFPNGKWNDFPCLDDSNHYVCEMAIELVKTKNNG